MKKKLLTILLSFFVFGWLFLSLQINENSSQPVLAQGPIGGLPPSSFPGKSEHMENESVSSLQATPGLTTTQTNLPTVELAGALPMTPLSPDNQPLGQPISSLATADVVPPSAVLEQSNASALLPTSPPDSLTLEPAANSCSQYLQNGGFEYNSAWFGYPLSNANYSYLYSFTGFRSGGVSTRNLIPSNAIIWQNISVPAGTTGTAVVRLYSGSIAGDPGEVVYVSIFDGPTLLASTYLIYPALGYWYYYEIPFPVAVVAGRTVQVTLQLAQDHDLFYSETYFDNASLVTCVTSPPSSEPDLGFRPIPDGYRFENYIYANPNSGQLLYDPSTDLTSGDLINLFGRNNVCANSVGSCVLNAPARAWRENQIVSMNGGHCYGMAVTSLRLFTRRENPGDFQAGATTTFNLTPDALVRRYIAYYFVTQALEPVVGTSNWIRTGSLATKLNLLQQSLQNGSDPYVIGFFFQINGKTAGHAVTPYAIKNQGNGIYWVYVYDNNYPGDAGRYFEFNLNLDTWRYFASTNPTQPPVVYAGSANNFHLRLLSDHDQPIWRCPFCLSFSPVAVQPAATNDKVEFSLTGAGRMLVINSAGQRVGYDPTTDQYVNEISQAEEVPIFTGLDQDISPVYRLPAVASSQPYTIIVSGNHLAAESNVNLIMSRAGFVVGFNSIQLDPGENVTMTIRPDGQQLTFKASQDGETPKLSLAAGPDPAQPSYNLEVTGMQISADKVVTVTLDLNVGRLYFRDDDGGEDNYDIDIKRININGTDNWYIHKDIVLGGQASAYVDFSTWDGEGPILLVIDNSLPVELANQVTRTYLPIIIKPQDDPGQNEPH